MNILYKFLAEGAFKYNITMPEDCPTISAALGFGDRNTIVPAKVRGNGNNKEYIYDIKQLTTKDVCHLNSLMLIEANRYVACGELSEIQNSIECLSGYPIRDYSFMKL